MRNFISEALTGRIRRFSRVAGTAVVCTAVFVACSDSPPTTVHGDATNLFGSFSLNMHAITIGSGATQALAPIAKTVSGQVISNPSGVRYRSVTVTKVTVDSVTGVITARAVTDPSSPVRIVAQLQLDGVTHVDTALVAVTAMPLVPKSFTLTSFNPVAPLGTYSYFGATLTDSAGNALQVPIYYATDSLRTVTLYPSYGFLFGVSYGIANIRASTTVNGVTYSAETNVKIVPATTRSIAFYGNGLGWWGALGTVIQAGGKVTWANYAGTPVAITFDQPDAAEPATPGDQGGNIPSFSSGSFSRIFTKVGTYNWSSGSTSAVIQVVPAVQ